MTKKPLFITVERLLSKAKLGANMKDDLYGILQSGLFQFYSRSLVLKITGTNFGQILFFTNFKRDYV